MHPSSALALLGVLALLLAGCGGGDGGSVSGTGYEVTLAEGWKDGTDKVEGSVIRFDLLIGKAGGTFNTNVNILRESVPDEVGLGDLRTIYRGQLDAVGATKITAAKALNVDDDDGFTYEYDQKSPQGDELHGRQVAVIHKGRAHTITLTALASRFASANDEFDEMLGSWRWK